jgi:formate-dependent nitrite reductase cytochrome c552 subunit
MAFRYWDDVGEVPAGCAKCHSATGLPEFIKNNGTVAVMAAAAVQTVGVGNAPVSNGLACATCHDDLTEYTCIRSRACRSRAERPSASARRMRRAHTDPVSSNLCLECHQGRASTASVNAALAT